MRLTINGKKYEVDRKEMEAKIQDNVKRMMEEHAGEARMVESMVRSLLGTIIGLLARKYPNLARPDGVDTIEHALGLVLNWAFGAWEKDGLELKAHEVHE